MDQLNQWFMEAAGFSGSALSLSIRTLIFLLSMFWGAFIFKGFTAEMHQSDDPMVGYCKAILLCILLIMIGVITY